MKIFEKVVETELVDGKTKIKSVSLHIGKKSKLEESHDDNGVETTVENTTKSENVVDGLIGGLVLAWFLSLFTFDKMVMDVIQSLLNMKSLSVSFYYVGFGLIGAILGFIRKL